MENIKKREYGTGSIVKLSGKRAKPYIAYLPNHIGNRVSLGTFTTKEEAKQALDFYLLPIEKKGDIYKKKITFQELAEDGLKRQEKYNLNSSQVQAHINSYKKLKPLYSKLYADITLDDVLPILEPYSASIKKHIRAFLKSLHTFASSNYFMIDLYDFTQDIHIQEPKNAKQVYLLDNKEVQYLWDICSEGDLKDNEYIYGLLIILYSGLKPSELLDIKVSDVSIQDLSIKIKGRTGERIIPIHNKIVPIIKKLMENKIDEQSLFLDGRIKISGQQMMCKKIANLQLVEHSISDLRETFIYSCAKCGVNEVCLNIMLGKKIKNTKTRSYYEYTLEDLRNEINKLNYNI